MSRFETGPGYARFSRAAVNFFHSEDGRSIPTDKIPQGGFWEMVDALYDAWDVMSNSPATFEHELPRLRALLDRYGVK